jgi:hypothetical protein
MAVLLVIIVALLLGGLSAILWQSGREFRTVREFVVEKKQSEYLAKGAQQHFLLKFRYLPTELYDAVAYATGKNPYYDFGRPHTGSGTLTELASADVLVNPGPMFFFGNTTVTLDSNGIPRVDRSSVDLDNPGGGLTARQIRALLNMYLLDVGTLYPTNDNKGIVVISSDAHEDNAMNRVWRDPFVGNYAVQNATILGLSGGKRYDSDSLLVTTVGSVKRAGQISLVTKGSIGGARNLSSGRRRISELNFGANQFPEVKSLLEDIEEYQKRMAEDASGDGNAAVLGLNGGTISSGRRTEVATGIYRISRKN